MKLINSLKVDIEYDVLKNLNSNATFKNKIPKRPPNPGSSPHEADISNAKYLALKMEHGKGFRLEVGSNIPQLYQVIPVDPDHDGYDIYLFIININKEINPAGDVEVQEPEDDHPLDE